MRTKKRLVDLLICGFLETLLDIIFTRVVTENNPRMNW